jgi:hypothetical protein
MNSSRRYIAVMLAAIAMCLTPQTSFGQMARGFHFARPYPVTPKHYGCFGYCPRPLTPMVPQHYGCFGYCPTPYPHYGCYGYCPLYPSHYLGGNPYSSSNGYYPYSSNSNYGDGSAAVSQIFPPYAPVDKNSSSKEEPSYRGLSVTDWIATLKNPYGGIRADAAASLGAMGPKAKNAVPALVEALKDERAEVRVEASRALAAIGEAALQPLTKALGDKDRQTRMGAALGHMGPNAKSATPALMDALEDPDIPVRCHAAQALWRVSGKANLSVPVLAEALTHTKAAVRKSAATALALIGPEAWRAVPALGKALNDDDPAVRARAADALRKIDQAGER